MLLRHELDSSSNGLRLRETDDDAIRRWERTLFNGGPRYGVAVKERIIGGRLCRNG